MSELIEWGGIAIPSVHIQETSFSQMAPAIRQGPEGERSDLLGLVKAKFSDFTGGLFRQRNASWTRDLNRYAYNEGLQTHIPGGLFLPYKLTTQTSIAGSEDPTGFRAANLRIHSLNTALGGASQRFYMGVGKRLYRDTSSSNPALEIPTGGSLTNNICSMAISNWNNSTYLACGTDGTTDDIKGTTDPTSGTVSWTTLVNLSGGDWVGAMAGFPTVGDGFTLYYGKIGGVQGLFYTPFNTSLPATPLRVVNSQTATIPNPSSAVVTSTRSPLVVQNKDNSGGTGWSNPENARVSDDSRASVTLAASTSSDFLYCQSYGFNLPSGSLIQGLEILIEGNDTGDMTFIIGQMLVGGVGTGDGGGGEFSSGADATLTFGSSSSLLGITSGLTAASINDQSFGVLVTATNISGASRTVNIDHVQLRVHYVPPGSPISLPVGGWATYPLPSNPNRWPLILPAVNDQSANTAPRDLWFADVCYSISGNWPLVTLSKVHTGLTSIEAAIPYAGGLALAGNLSNGLGKQVKFVDANGQVRDLGFLGEDGFPAPVGVVNLFSSGRVLIADVGWEDGSQAQHWYYFDGTWHASTPLQTKSSTISSIPIGWAEAAVNLNQQYRYRFFPRSSAAAASYAFQPQNIFENPLENSTAVLKQDGPLFLRTPEFDLGGPEESNKVLLSQTFLGRQISATAGAYGTVQIETETGGDTTFASPAVTTGALRLPSPSTRSLVLVQAFGQLSIESRSITRVARRRRRTGSRFWT